MSNKELATWLAREIFAIGDDGPNRKAVRLQYRTGSLQSERPGGGMIERSLANCLEHLLDRHAKLRAAQETFACLGGCGTNVPGPNAYCSSCFQVERRKAKETRPVPEDRWIKHSEETGARPEHVAAHDCACAACVAAERRCSCKDFPGADEFCTAHKAPETQPARMQELNAKFAGRERGDDWGELMPRLSEEMPPEHGECPQCRAGTGHDGKRIHLSLCPSANR